MLRALCTLAGLALGCAETSLFQIEIPQALYKAGGYRHQEALFGTPKYGGTLAQRLYYSNSTLCDPGATAGNGYPAGEWKSPYFLMVDRGECKFVTKARNAQRLGASGLVVADSQCRCGDSACVSDLPCETTEPIMSDDGSGADISIPAILLEKVASDAVKRFLKCGRVTAPGAQCADAFAAKSNNAIVQAKLEWSVPAPDDRVEWELWTTAIDESGNFFLQDFKPTVLALGRHQEFTPHFYTFNGTDYGCDYGPQNNCGNLCTNGGRYCAPDPDGAKDRGLSGADVVAENLRRSCVWQLYGGSGVKTSDAQHGVGEAWWDYVGNFSKLCDTQEEFRDPSCVDRAMKAAKVDRKRVLNCMEDAGGVEADVPNFMLEREVAELARKAIYAVPEVIVNGAIVWGRLDAATVLSAICHGFSRGDAPGACDCVDAAPGSSAYAKCVEDAAGGGGKGSKTVTRTGVPWWGLFLAAVLVVVAGLVAALGYWKYTQQQMRDQVRGILAEYMPLDDLGADARPNGRSEISLAVHA
ncbi:hypothetical protein M885DRAFT_528392 [Pelagophyceae sp. CCMP2097]|nr:hypothetical protein M885DRAFT_528392 [Pelagophyceae sp. CCMP2097]